MIKAHYKKQFLNSCKLFSYLFIERQYGDFLINVMHIVLFLLREMLIGLASLMAKPPKRCLSSAHCLDFNMPSVVSFT